MKVSECGLELFESLWGQRIAASDAEAQMDHARGELLDGDKRHDEPSLMDSAGGTSEGLEAASKNLDDEVDLSAGDAEVGCETKGILASVNHTQSVESAPLFDGIEADDGEPIGVELSAQEQTCTLYFGDAAWEFFGQLFESGYELVPTIANIVTKLGSDAVEDRHGGLQCARVGGHGISVDSDHI